jgi:hypothetical protein
MSRRGPYAEGSRGAGYGIRGGTVHNHLLCAEPCAARLTVPNGAKRFCARVGWGWLLRVVLAVVWRLLAFDVVLACA